MKKLLSLAVATIMAVSTMVTAAFAAVNPTIQVNAVEFSEAENTQYAKVLGGTKKGYWVSFDISDIGTLEQVEDELGLGDIGGRKLSTAQMALNFSDATKVSRVTNMGGTIAAKADCLAGYDKDNTNLYSIAFSSAGAAKSYPVTTGSAVTEIKDVLKLMVIVSEDVTVVPTITGQLTTYDADNGGAPVTGSEEPFDKTLATITLKAASTETKVTGITVAANNMTVGDADQAPTVTVTPADATDASYTLTSSNTNAATIVDGKIHAVAAGTTTIKATANDGSGVYGETTITISEPVRNPEVTVGERADSTTTGKDKAFAWLMTIKHFDADWTYTGKFVSGEESRDLSFDFSGVTGEADVNRIVILHDFHGTINPTFTATATK